MFGFIRRLFGKYTPGEKRTQGYKYALETIKDVRLYTERDSQDYREKVEGGTIMSLSDEWKALRTAAISKGCDNDMAYANGIQDYLEQWLQEQDDTIAVKADVA
jgi:hypothetical protein